MRKPHPSFRHIVREASRAIRRYRMIADGDRIAVGLSGGKDSMLLMHVLTYLQRRAPVDFQITALVVDGGFTTFHPERIEAYCLEQGWAVEFIRLEMKQLIEERGLEDEPCAFCSRLRRGKLYGAAHKLGCGKLALGQHLDDACATLLLGLFRGKGIGTMGANVPADGGALRLIRPLITLPESDLVSAAAVFSFPECGECDYLGMVDREGDRAWLEQEMERLSGRFPDIRKAMLASMQKLNLPYLLDPRYLKWPDLSEKSEEQQSDHGV